jgi:hypothetical protein
VRISFLVYGVLYVVVEMIGYRLGQLGWVDISAMDVATAVTDACLAVSLVLAALLGAKLAAERWGAPVRSWWDSLGHPDVVLDDGAPVDPTYWRPSPLTVTAERVEAPPQPTYAGNPYSFGGHRWPADRGRQL